MPVHFEKEESLEKRLGSLETAVQVGFQHQQDQIQELREEVRSGFEQVDQRFEEVNKQLKLVFRALRDVNHEVVTCPACSKKYIVETSPQTRVTVTCPYCGESTGWVDAREPTK